MKKCRGFDCPHYLSWVNLEIRGCDLNYLQGDECECPYNPYIKPLIAISTSTSTISCNNSQSN